MNNNWTPIIIVGAFIFIGFLLLLWYSLCVVAGRTDDYQERLKQVSKEQDEDEDKNTWDNPRM